MSALDPFTFWLCFESRFDLQISLKKLISQGAAKCFKGLSGPGVEIRHQRCLCTATIALAAFEYLLRVLFRSVVLIESVAADARSFEAEFPDPNANQTVIVFGDQYPVHHPGCNNLTVYVL